MNLVKMAKVFLIGASISICSSIPAFATATAIVTEDIVSTYLQSNDNNTISGELYRNNEVVVLSKEDGWLKILGEDFSEIYIPSNVVNITVVKATVTENDVNIRKEPSINSNILDKVYKEDTVVVTAKVGDWYEINYNNEVAYVYGQYLSSAFLNELPHKIVEVAAPAPNSDLGTQIVAYAKRFLGTRYVYGGTNLSTGVDCSGFTSSVLRNFGVIVGRSSRDQYNNGVRISKSQLQPGDLVFFNTGGKSQISHVGLYIGDGKFIHSSSSWTGGVIISGLNENYYATRYVGATRVI